ncbi:inverse autotransporter beta domain-containing protein [Vibrio mediterranei]|uniref:inverse autotransporter beta domain-containing protein n=1 Tax=Vibrio mediterranei TaxID=689 RepID=UPI00148C6784|nr:inverse autotransporter beta domain-containing protein [Vibrio mediterranei]NOI26819.1 hypothetical protein [Vibrio mediterranei]
MLGTTQRSIVLFTLLSYSLTASAPAYSNNRIQSGSTSRRDLPSQKLWHPLPSDYYQAKGNFYNHMHSQHPLWVRESSRNFSSWQDASQRTSTPIADLLRLNQAEFRSQLPKGDIWVYAPAKDSVSSLPLLGGTEVDDSSDIATEQKIASEMFYAGQMIEEGGTEAYVDQLESRGLNYGNSIIEDGVTDWFSSYGTVRFSTDWLNNLDDPSASLGLLVPLYDSHKNLFFSQLRLRENIHQYLL